MERIIPDSDDEEYSQSTPPELADTSHEAAAEILPDKSKEYYEKMYNTFIEWQNSHKTQSTSENTLLAYFKELRKTHAPSTLWVRYSILKTMININKKVNIASYPILLAYLKKSSSGYESKKSAVLSSEQVNNFLNNAPDIDYLVTKVALIMGIMGACRSQELVDMKVHDVREEGKLLVVTLPITKTKTTRSFVIGEKFVDIVKKYQALRPEKINTDRFFINYRKNKCTVQVIGKHKIAAMPKSIALFLKLKDHEKFTGHCFRRTAATIFANSGGSMMNLKELGGWKSDAVAQGYVQQSIHNKSKISAVFDSAVGPSTSHDSTSSDVENEMSKRQKLDNTKAISDAKNIESFQNVLTTKQDINISNCTVYVQNYFKKSQ